MEITKEDLNSEFWKYATKPVAFFTIAVIIMIASVLWLPFLLMLPVFIFNALVAWLTWQDIKELRYGTCAPKHLAKWKLESEQLRAKIKEQKIIYEKLNKAIVDMDCLEQFQETVRSLREECTDSKLEFEELKKLVKDLKNSIPNAAVFVGNTDNDITNLAND